MATMRGSGVGPAAGGPDGDLGAVRAGALGDAGAVAELHARLISDGFLSSLGPRFLHRLYRRMVLSDGSFLLVAEGDGAVVGFVAGSTAVGRLYRDFLVRDGVAATLRAPLRLATALPRVLETLRHGRDPGADGPGPGAEGGELLAVAVDPRWRGRRLGGQLVDGFLGELERRGATSGRVVVGADNAAAVAMYRRAGFAPARTFEFHRGVASVLMETAVPPVRGRR